MIPTKHGTISCPNLFPTIGWPAGRGEYDRLFQTLDYFCNKLNHYHFLFNFSSFIFGFTIPKPDFNKIFQNFKDKDLRDSLVDNTGINNSTAKKLIILLDVGGNRIFNKVILDNNNPSDIASYEKYIDAYFEFINKANIDIYVNFDIGPSYSTRDDISRKGVKIWQSLSQESKNELNKRLLEISIEKKDKDSLLMVPISAEDTNSLNERLKYLYENFEDNIDYLAIGGIANKGISHVSQALNIIRKFIDQRAWVVKIHGLGLGGLKNIPLLEQFKIDTCDAATPWRRACTDAISKMYVPLFDSDLNFTSHSDALKYYEIYHQRWDDISCNCPFCQDISIKEIQKRYRQSDKNISGASNHMDEYYIMRVRIFYHNFFQHFALFRCLHNYKEEFGGEYIDKFSKKIKNSKLAASITKKG